MVYSDTGLFIDYYGVSILEFYPFGRGDGIFYVLVVDLLIKRYILQDQECKSYFA